MLAKMRNADLDDDVRAISLIDSVPSILDVCCQITGMRFAAIARVTEARWTVCAVRDGIEFGLAPGGELKIETTICNEIRSSRSPVVISHVAEDSAFRDHATPKQYGFQSYISIPIVRTNGEFFGTLCAIDPLPAKLSAPSIRTTFELFAKLIAFHLDGIDDLERSRAELLNSRQTAELREQFIAVLGHDLRNPVAAIEGGARLLEKLNLDDRSQKVLTLMQASCRRMTSLIGDVLDFARGRLGGGLAIDPRTSGDLAPVLLEVVDEVRIANPERTIVVSLDIDEPVTCEPARIAQLLSNLLANAVMHGDPREPVFVRGSTGNGIFQLIVANHGRAIPPDRIATLFQPFTRADEGHPQQGLGLGLYIAAEIAKAHCGILEVASDDVETRFTLKVPAGSQHDQPPS